jgi:hypothetical protein
MQKLNEIMLKMGVFDRARRVISGGVVFDGKISNINEENTRKVSFDLELYQTI